MFSSPVEHCLDMRAQTLWIFDIAFNLFFLMHFLLRVSVIVIFFIFWNRYWLYIYTCRLVQLRWLDIGQVLYLWIFFPWNWRFTGIKPRPNGVASRHKLKTWVYLRLHLARACVHLPWLAMTCAHFGWDPICTQVKASFSLFGHPTQIKASWVTSINLLLASEIEDSLP